MRLEAKDNQILIHYADGTVMIIEDYCLTNFQHNVSNRYHKIQLNIEAKHVNTFDTMEYYLSRADDTI